MTAFTTTDTEQRVPADASALSRYYTDLLCWPTTIDPSVGEVRLRLGDTVDALIMRAGFGSEVNHQLVRSMLSAPIIVVPGRPDEWIFLTQPRTPMRDSTIAHLVSLQVGWKEAGSTIVLPAFGSAASELRWLAQPNAGLELPSWVAVVGAVRRTASARAW